MSTKQVLIQFWPIVLIGLGAVLLLQMLGLFPAGLWAALAQLWPVLLILLGLQMLIGRRSAGSALVVSLGVLVIAGSLVAAALRAAQLPAGGPQTLVQAPGGAVRLSARLTFQSGSLSLSLLGPSENLTEVSLRNGPGQSTRQAYAVTAGEGRLDLAQQSLPLLAPFLARRPGAAAWDVRLAPNLPLALDVDTGAGAAALDLTGLQLTRLNLTSGAGQTTVTFPAGQPAQALVRTGLGLVTLNLPAGLPARLTLRFGLTHVTLPPRFTHSGSVYTTPNFDPSRPFLDLDLTPGLGRVVVQ